MYIWVSIESVSTYADNYDSMSFLKNGALLNIDLTLSLSVATIAYI